MNKHLLLLAAALPAVTGCASIVRGGSQEINISSSPDQATFEILDNKGNSTPISGVTPGKVTLRKGAGYFKGGSYTVKLTKPGYAPSTVNLDSSISGWYLGGNLLVGGLIGYFIVDPVTGAMWKLEPDNLQVGLAPLVVPQAAPAVMPPLAPSTTEAAPFVPAAPAAVAPAALQPGTVVASRAIQLRAQPRSDGSVAKAIPAGASLQLQSRQSNGEGVWWFAHFDGAAGWVSESALQ
jgi:hypothetical protein